MSPTRSLVRTASFLVFLGGGVGGYLWLTHQSDAAKPRRGRQRVTAVRVIDVADEQPEALGRFEIGTAGRRNLVGVEVAEEGTLGARA